MSDRSKEKLKGHSGPEVVAPTNRVNVALPFGSVHIEESSKELVELAKLVAELAAVTEDLSPGPRVRGLREHAQELALRLR